MEQPPIRILQRPCQMQSENPVDCSRPPVAVKTFEQREADYAAARRRIMGSETPEPTELEKSINKGVSKMATTGQSANVTKQPSSPQNGLSALAPPLMSIQTSPTPVDCQLGLPISNSVSLASAAVPPRSSRPRPSMAASTTPKLQSQQQQQPLNDIRQVQRTLQQQQRVMSASASSPSLFSHATRNSNVPMIPSFDQQNAGLLPTPASLANMMQNMSFNNSFTHSPMAAAALVHQFNLLHQQYQQTFAGIQGQVVPPLAAQTPTGGTNLTFSSNVQPAIPSRYSFHSTFN